jgi:BR serine/threonine kinase
LNANAQGYLPFDDMSIKALLTKVKRGKFVMPAWHPDIQDLVKQMLTVDASKRITVAGIKQHPAFRMMIPPTYALPTPLPAFDLNAPIDPEVVTEDVQTALARIGVTSEDIAEALSSPDWSIVKLFIIKLTRKVELGELPWDQAVSEMPEDFTEDDFMPDGRFDAALIRSVDQAGF